MEKAGAWKERVETILAAAPGKYISKECIRSIERGPAGRVRVAVKRAFIAETMEAKKLKTATKKETKKGNRAVWDLMPSERKFTQMLNNSETAQEANVMRRVRRWVHSHAETGRGTPHLTAPMVSAMKKNLGKKENNITAREVEAGIVNMAAEGGVTATWRPAGRGKATRTQEQAMQDARSTMAGWGLSEEQVVERITLAAHKVTVHAGNLVALDFGEGYGGMKEGMTRVMQTYGIDRDRHSKGKEGKTTPDLQTDFRAGEEQSAQNLVRLALKQALVREEEHPYAHFSPDCDPESILNRLEKENGRGRGSHAGKAREPTQEKAVRAVIRAITEQSERNPAWAWTLEQPKGSAMQEMIPQEMGEPVEVHQCCYGYLHCKPTWIWTNLYPRYWKPRPFKKGQCSHCHACNTGQMHEERMLRRGSHDTRPPAGTATMPGFTREAARNRIAPDLAEELARAALRKWQTEQG